MYKYKTNFLYSFWSDNLLILRYWDLVFLKVFFSIDWLAESLSIRWSYNKSLGTRYAPNLFKTWFPTIITRNTPTSRPQRPIDRAKTMIGLGIILCTKQALTYWGPGIEDSGRETCNLAGCYYWLGNDLCKRLLSLGWLIAVLFWNWWKLANVIAPSPIRLSITPDKKAFTRDNAGQNAD